MKRIIFLSFITLGISLSSCQNQARKSVDANATINTTLSVEEFDSKLNEDSIPQLIDVRTGEEFNQGHLKGALNYDINSNGFETQISSLDKTKPVYVYCRSGARSSSAASFLERKGFTKVYNMGGGITKWSAANKPLGDESTNAIASSGLSMQDFNNFLKTEKYVLVDYNAKWCPPCKKMAPMLSALAENKKEKLNLVKIDADENKDLMRQKGIEVLPVLELYKDGKLIWSHKGEIDEATLMKETKL